jgi:hypothetical protein
MQVRFDRKTYRKRVQVETVVSMIKRRLGNDVRARSRWGQVRELALVVLTHNLMTLWCSILFYRAGLTPLISPLDDFIPHVLEQLASCQVANRPHRIEPRVLKRRRHAYKFMLKPRDVLRAELLKKYT